MFDFLHIVFLYPDATTLNWDSNVLDELWNSFLIAGFVINLIVFGWYYFKTLPSLNAKSRFYTTSIVLSGLICLIVSVYMYESRSSLFVQSSPWTLQHVIVVAASTVVSELVLIMITLIIYIGLSFITIMPGNLRAMRRYPFSWIP